jgi:hypothetical protein
MQRAEKMSAALHDWCLYGAVAVLGWRNAETATGDSRVDHSRHLCCYILLTTLYIICACMRHLLNASWTDCPTPTHISHLPPMIQFHFNEVIFSEETAMYAAEGVPTESVVFEDNAECVKLIEGGTLCAAAVSVWPVCLVVSVV